jgi:hypothetical protein
LIIVSNFEEKPHQFRLKLDKDIVSEWKLNDGSYTVSDILTSGSYDLIVKNGVAFVELDLEPLESHILKL